MKQRRPATSASCVGSGSSLQSQPGLLGFGGLLSGALLGVAAIYAQVKNLWWFAPRWFRHTSWAILTAVAIVALVSSATRSS